MSVDPEYAAKHRAQVNLRDKKKRDNWSPQHREHRRKLERDRYHAIHKHNPRWKAEHNLRVRLKKFIVGHKSLTMRTLLGCTKDGLVRHLEKHFQRGMTWQNYGTKWHIDHVQPCASFDLTNVEDQKRCFHFSNLRPLWATENWSKGARIVTHQPELLLCNS